MKKLLLAIAAFIIFTNLAAQTVTVTNGYGSGSYNTGDTVNIWSVAFDSTKVFVNWTGDTAGIANAGEWHTSFIMPSHNVAVTANLRTVNSYAIPLQKIRGKNNLKNVYAYFPAGMKGVIYCLHGTDGSASGWITRVENRQFVNAAIADSFGIIVTEAEEITLNTDINGDGKLRWFTGPLDSVNNVDYANIKAITDTFILRGKFSRTTPRYSMGMSDGGAFSSSLSYLFNFAAGVSYCASGINALFNSTMVPTQFCMAKYDNNENVGPTGNADALNNYNTLISRSVCSGYYLHDHSPCYPERFARLTGVSVSASQNIYNEFLSHGFMNSKHFFIYPADTIAARVLSNPAAYPAIVILPAVTRADIIMQIGVMNAEHNFYSDLNRTTLNFIKNPCGKITAVITAGGSTGFCTGGSVQLSANNGSGYTYQWLKNNIVISNAISQTYSATSSGNYSVRITAPGNNSAVSNSIAVTVNALPAPQVTPASAIVCPGSTVTLSTTATFAAYAWSTGATSQTITVSSAGTYFVNVTNNFGCIATASAIVTGSSSCNAPTNLSVSSVSKIAATLNWTAAPCAYSYKIQYRKTGTTAWTNVTVNPPATSKTITGLTGATGYQWKIRTQCSSGTGNQSSYSSIQTFTTTNSLREAAPPVEDYVPEYVSVYPNPAKNSFTVNTGQKNAKVIITDLAGRVLFQTNNVFDKIEISCISFPAGIYIVNMIYDSRSTVKNKIVVIR